MRLLCIETPWKFVDTDQPPPYAILSHTWYRTDFGQSEEVTYQELRSYLNDTAGAESLPAKGLDKIQQAIRIAAADGYEYIWIDTCCIDKTNSAELDESIRCMFQWYKDAAVCYAYLSDVSPVRDPAVEISPDLVASRWFRRGWTLQELVAPSDVKFLARDWTVLGTRMAGGKFGQALTDATGIDGDVLYGSVPMLEINIAVRMKWASRRETTRIEDMAYSLMGIFNVHMPIMYGEGKASFIRLQEEILKTANDQSIFTWTSSEDNKNEISGLLADSPRGFANAVNMQLEFASNTSEEKPEWQSTSQRTKMRLYVNLIHNSYYYAFLECTLLTAQGVRLNPVLCLRRIEGNQFARVLSSTLDWSEYSRFVVGASYITLYVEQNPTYRLPVLAVAQENIKGNQAVAPQGFQLEDVCPAMFWNGTSFTRGTAQSLQSPIALFRFSCVADPSCRIEVAVGFQVQGLDQLSVWHIQRACGNEPMHKVFAQLNRRGSTGLDYYLSACAKGWTCGLLGDSRVTIAPKKWIGEPPPHQTFEIKVEGLLEADSTPLAHIQGRHGAYSWYGGIPETITHDVYVDAVHHVSALIQPHTTAWAPSSDFFSSAPSPGLVRLGRPNYAQLREMLASAPVEHSRAESLKYLLACKNGSVDAVLGVLKSSEGFNALRSRSASFHGFTGLHWAAACGHAEVVKHMLRFGDDAQCLTAEGWSACHLAAAMGRSAVVGLLLKHDRSLDTFRLPHNATTAKNIAENSDEDADENSDEKTLAGPCSSNGYESIYHIAASCADVSSDNLHSAFWFPPHEDRIPMTPLDMRHIGLSIQNYQGETPLHCAAVAGNTAIVHLLLSINKSMLTFTDLCGRTALWHAAAAGHTSMVSLLASHGANVNTQDMHGMAPLHTACRNGHTDVVFALINLRADPNICTYTSHLTPAHFASYASSRDCVALLRDASADMVGKDTPLQFSTALEDIKAFADGGPQLYTPGADNSFTTNFVSARYAKPAS